MKVVGVRVADEIRRSSWISTGSFVVAFLGMSQVLDRAMPDASLLTEYLILFPVALLVDIVVIYWRRKVILSTVESELQKGAVPDEGMALVLVEMLFFGILNNEIREKIIEFVFKRDAAGLILHQETMQRYARRWLMYIWANWKKDSPLHRLAADLAYHEGWLPVDIQEKMKKKLYSIGTALER